MISLRQLRMFRDNTLLNTKEQIRSARISLQKKTSAQFKAYGIAKSRARMLAESKFLD